MCPWEQRWDRWLENKHKKEAGRRSLCEGKIKNRPEIGAVGGRKMWLREIERNTQRKKESV